jgi:OmcA/MtrC family decaheme c-type cytochrome
VTVLVTNAAGTTPNKLNASGGNAADVPWAQTSTGASRLAVDIGWSTTVVTSAGDTNYTNDGSGQKAGQPVSLDVLKNGVYNSADGSYTVTSTVAIPANAVGAGIVALEGHPADAQGNRIAVKSATAPFAITGTAAARRSVVDINKCNLCHQNLSLHGNNRTSSIETCVICHNTNATDISRRPTDGTATADGKAEESVDFKRLIHGIHGASFSGAGPVIYGFGSSANDFSKAGYPGYLYNCEACHNAGTYSSTAFVPENGTTTSTSGDPLTPAGFLRTTKITATCSSCHASVPDRGHMEANGGALGVTQAQIDAVNQ